MTHTQKPTLIKIYMAIVLRWAFRNDDLMMFVFPHSARFHHKNQQVVLNLHQPNRLLLWNLFYSLL